MRLKELLFDEVADDISRLLKRLMMYDDVAFIFDVFSRSFWRPMHCDDLKLVYLSVIKVQKIICRVHVGLA